MAEGAVRKSNRIQSRARTIYTEDDFDYEIHFDVSGDISDILESRSQKKNNDKLGTRRKTYPQVSKRVNKKPERQGSKSTSENNKHAFGEFLENSDADGVVNSPVSSQATCLICSEVFLSEKMLENHMVQHKSDHTKVKGFLVCDVCDRICVDQSSYDRHMKSHSSSRRYKCDICDKAFADSCSLKRHVKSHYDERLYSCELCFKSFRDNPSLIRHQKTHTDRPRMFQCLTCDKNFADKHSLKRHERTHTGLRPFECKTCFKTFSEPGSFKRHLKIHTGVRNFLCPICSRSFLEKQSLLRHQKNVCGFGDAAMTSEASFHSSFSGDHSRGSHDSGADNSEISHTSVGQGGSSALKNSLTGNSLSTLTPASSSVQPKTYTLQAVNSASVDSADKSNISSDLKEAPSLHSLIRKDPNLYDSITEIVKSIDSYEKMLDLCGDTGQVEIDAALTKVPAPMPDNLLCFECGELLVNGENFKGDGKSFHPRLCNSYKCSTCEDEVDYGEPPVLTAEVHVSGISSSGEEMSGSGTTDGQIQERKPEFVSKNFFGTDETLEHLRERLRTQHGVFFVGDMYDDEDESDTNDQAEISSNATTSRSYSTDSDLVHTFVNKQDTSSNPDLCDNSSSNVCKLEDLQQDLVASKESNTTTSTTEATHVILSSITPKMDYEADDQSIPSVFPCHLCTKVFATSAFLTRHLVLHKNSPYKCMVCGKTFTNSPSLKRHMTLHTGEKPYTCPHCTKRFRDPSNFSKHKKQCSASLSVTGPAVSIFSTSSVSSPQSLDDSNTADNAKKYVADLKQKLSFPFHSPTPKASETQDIPVKLSYDNDDEEDLPVAFGHPHADSNAQSVVRQSPEIDGRFVKDSLKSEAEYEIPHNDWNDVRDEADVPVACEVCGRTFKNKQLLEMHMNYHSGNPKVTCIECGKSFADSFGLKRHFRIHAGIRPHVCEYCGRGYCDNWSLRKHKSRGCMLVEVKVPVDFLHPCPQCTRVFSELECLEEHQNTHKGNLKFECDICQKKFSEAFNLKRHHRLHMAICPGCDREFKDIQALNEHQTSECPVNIPYPDTTSKEDGFSCPECGRNYTTKAYLERHKKFHSDLKPYICEICNKRFSEAFRLRRHFKTHKINRSFSCESCGKGFTNIANLKRHKTNSSCNSTSKEKQPHQGIVDFHCVLCDKTFSKSYLLARHMNVHSQDRPFACDVCERTYKDTSSLRRHQLIHQGIKSFICPNCGKDFFYADSLKRHMSGTCGKKSKSRRRSKGRNKGRSKKKSNNNTNMKNNNTIEKDLIILDMIHEKDLPNSAASLPQMSSLKNKVIYQTHNPARDVKVGHWSCHKKKHCWRCDLRFKSTSSLLEHSRIHRHRKPWLCSHCFLRWSRKLYWKVHLRTHKSEPERVSDLVPLPKEELKRPQRSIPRARWSWISKL